MWPHQDMKPKLSTAVETDKLYKERFGKKADCVQYNKAPPKK